jgi:hypothetical protein
MNSYKIIPTAARVARGTLRIALLLWAGCWACFVLAVSYGGAEAPPPTWIPLLWLVSLTGLVFLCWRWPRWGGLVLIGAALWSATYFTHTGARALLAAPALALGLGCLLTGRRSCAHNTPLLLLGLLTLGGCLVPQDPADRPYRSGSILRHESGAMKRGWLLETTELAGYPCQGWTWLYEDGRLDNFELARDFTVQGHVFPARTRLFLDREGRLAHAWLARDTLIDGLPCRGKWKIDTAFHPNGRVRAFFPCGVLEIDGVSCAASVFHPVYLHPDGHLRQCKLARAASVAGRTIAQGVTLELDEQGQPVRP